ncbi:gastrula zinc finger protein XlCGF8.2DB-like [Syngnathus acus]|uniref:gastrula zinc finger protein XlCGF8.2DB-like n=1 Tax=Syngnathus acus TaxID=161584 RepID=UPI001886501F|nr:gastrula zinc finger protein XlCGF8.2DB-like [Syngnathus acus]
MEKPPRSNADSEDIQPLIAYQEELPPHPPHVKDEQEEPMPLRIKEQKVQFHIKEEEQETDVSKLPLIVAFVKKEDDEDEPAEWSQLHPHGPSGGAPSDDVSGPLSDINETQEPLGRDTDSESDGKQLTGSENETSGGIKETSQTCKKRVTCSVCSKRFATKQTLITHMRTHTGEKPFSCSFCGKEFSQKGPMLRHIRVHTGEKPFSCSVCSKTFSQKGSIELHMRTHTGEKPFRCSTCGKTFSQKENMVTHMRKHTGEKPFRCSDCGKMFSRKEHVLTHMRTHTGGIPFTCSVCGESYGHRASLTEHMRKHNTESK